MVDGAAGAVSCLEAVLDRTGYLAELQTSTDPQDEAGWRTCRSWSPWRASSSRTLSPTRAPRRPSTRVCRCRSLAGFLERVALVADADQMPGRRRTAWSP